MRNHTLQTHLFLVVQTMESGPKNVKNNRRSSCFSAYSIFVPFPTN